MPTNEDILRSRGYAPDAGGVWHKAVAGAADSPGWTEREPAAKRPLAHRESVEKPATGRVLAIVTVRTVASRDYDGLGPASKGYLDCLADTGLIPDDDPDSLEVLFNPEAVRHYADEETIIELFQLKN